MHKISLGENSENDVQAKFLKNPLELTYETDGIEASQIEIPPLTRAQFISAINGTISMIRQVLRYLHDYGTPAIALTDYRCMIILTWTGTALSRERVVEWYLVDKSKIPLALTSVYFDARRKFTTLARTLAKDKNIRIIGRN